LGSAWWFLAPALFCVHRGLPTLRLRAFALLILARLSCWLVGWARTVAAWQRCHRGHKTHADPRSREKAAKAAHAPLRGSAAGHLIPAGCKERSVCCWALVRWAGLLATLVLGVNLYPFAGHCWCESGPWVLTDSPERVQSFTPVLRYA